MFRTCLSSAGSILSSGQARNVFRRVPSALQALRTPSTRLFSSAWTLRSQESTAKSSTDLGSSERGTKENSRRASSSSKTSLRRVAVEAERSRGGGKLAPTKQSKADRDADAKVVTAYCAAEQYSIAAVSKILEAAGYSLDPFRTGLYPQVVHFKVPPSDSRLDDGMQNMGGDIFVFPSGTVVAWDVDEGFMMKLVSKDLLPAAENSHLTRMETEDLEFVEDPESNTSSVVGDTIKLGMGMQEPGDSQEPQSMQQHQTDLALVKIAFSSGLAGSAKLAVLESGLESYFRSTRSIPTMLSKGSRLPFTFTRSFILRKTGELLNARAQLNLNSELTDSLPDMFWDSRHELGLEGYFDRIGKVLDVNVRSRVLNQKMDYAQEIVTVLREQLSEKHGLALEWLIIILIAFEVAFEILRLWKEKREREDPRSLESLLRLFLEIQLSDERAEEGEK